MHLPEWRRIPRPSVPGTSCRAGRGGAVGIVGCTCPGAGRTVRSIQPRRRGETCRRFRTPCQCLKGSRLAPWSFPPLAGCPALAVSGRTGARPQERDRRAPAPARAHLRRAGASRSTASGASISARAQHWLIFKLGSATNGWGRCEKERDAALARVAEFKAQAQHSVPDGWKLVPVEPTPEMLDARRDCEDGMDGYLVEDTEYYFPGRDAVRAFLARVYRGLIAAAPAPGGER